MRALRRFLQYFIATVLLVTALGKLLDNRGFAEVLVTYQIPASFPLLLSLGLAVSLAELFLALWLFVGKRLRLAAIFAFIMHLFYAAWSALSLLRGLQIPNCGCFGVFLARPLAWSTVTEDLVMTAFCLALVYLSPPLHHSVNHSVKLASKNALH